jgi:hypothetical protein
MPKVAERSRSVGLGQGLALRLPRQPATSPRISLHAQGRTNFLRPRPQIFTPPPAKTRSVAKVFAFRGKEGGNEINYTFLFFIFIFNYFCDL